MKKIILIGSEGALGKYYTKNLIKFNKILVVADIKIKKNLRKGKLVKRKLNIENEEEVKSFFNEISRLYGKFDVLINNAGLTNDGIQKIKKKNIIKKILTQKFGTKLLM